MNQLRKYLLHCHFYGYTNEDIPNYNVFICFFLFLNLKKKSAGLQIYFFSTVSFIELQKTSVGSRSTAVQNQYRSPTETNFKNRRPIRNVIKIYLDMNKKIKKILTAVGSRIVVNYGFDFGPQSTVN